MSSREMPRRVVSRPNYDALNDGLEGVESVDFVDLKVEFEEDLINLSSEPADSVDEPASTLVESTNSASQQTVSAELTTDDDEGAFKMKSWIWNHFNRTKLDMTFTSKNKTVTVNDYEVKCDHCGWATADSKRKGSTSNMVTHIMNSHKRLFTDATSSVNMWPNCGSKTRRKPNLQNLSRICSAGLWKLVNHSQW
ncbi:hypothetical protein V1514DRAFT_46843 [Lipomyces japonicus]|uniref:uncharacterized protein n=1 Tax=Lipomyces japonicus TaxID=56871 RepID=UPI0034CFEAD1